MDKNIANHIYQEFINANLGELLDLITNAEHKDEKDFYTNIFNYVIKKRQKECVDNGIF